MNDSHVSEFWAWFDTNKTSIVKGMVSHDPDVVRETLANVNQNLARDHQGVSFLFGHNDDGFEFIATCNGFKERIPNVLALVESAPPIADWTVSAFRPPSTEEMRITMDGTTMSASDIAFQGFDLGSEGLGITLYPSGMTEDNRKLYSRLSVALMDHVVGEFDAATKIGSLRVDPPSEIPTGTEVTPLIGLRKFLGEWEREGSQER